MKEQLISFETAKLANKKGFIIWTQDRYNKKGTFDYSKVWSISAPTQSLLQKWLREIHSIYVTALPFRDTEDGIELCFYFSIVEDSEELDDILCNEYHLGASDDNYETYEEALEAGLQEALNLIK